MEFLTFVEADFFEKGGESSTESKMWVEGIASTGSEDTDKHMLLADGFDLSYLKERGFFNWHHKASQTSSMVVGEPTEAYVSNGQLLVKGFLYNGQPEAKNVYNLAKTLQRESKNRRLGFSIEGKITERDKNNPNLITKAQITNIAITFMPKNWDTSLGLIAKADDYSDFQFEYEDNEEIIKAIGEESSTNDGLLTKNEARLDIFLKYPDIDFEKADQIYGLANKIEQMNVSQEALDKAYELLGIASEDAPKLEKADSTETVEVEVEASEEAEVEKEVETSEEAEVEKEVETEVELEKADKEEVVQGEFDFEKAFNELFEKSTGDFLSKADTESMFEDMKSQNDGLKNAVKTIITGLNTNFQNKVDSLTKAFEDEIEKLRNEPIAPRRAVSRDAIIEKSMESSEDGALSVTFDKDEIKKAMDEIVFADGGYNDKMGNALMEYESTGNLPIEAIVELRKKGLKISNK